MIYHEEWVLLESLVAPLARCEEATRVLSCADHPDISSVYPTITGLLRNVTNEMFDNDSLKADKSCLVNELSTRFIDSIWKSIVVVTMVLDTRFKFLLICKEPEKKEIMEEVKEILAEHVNESPQLVKDNFP